jgi:hypothetical protein
VSCWQRTVFWTPPHSGLRWISATRNAASSLRGGLTEQHYDYFAPWLNEKWEQVKLATAVLKNKLRHLAWWKLEAAWRQLRKKYGQEEEDWLTSMIADKGFAAIASELEAAWVEAERTLPPSTFPSSVNLVPHWDCEARILSLRFKQWRFRNQDGPTLQLLAALQDRGFPRSIRLKGLTERQVHEAARYLRKKTKDFIYWSAPSDGTLSWWLK